MTRTYEFICLQQRAWANRLGIKIDKEGYTLSLKDNLYKSFSLETEKELKSGKGEELGHFGSRGRRACPNLLTHCDISNKQT